MIFKNHKVKKAQRISSDMLEKRLEIISELTRGLGKKEFNALIEAVKGMYDVRAKLANVKNEDEKDSAEIDSIEKELKKEEK